MKPLQIEEIHKEIDLVQDCIKRMSNNSFYIKEDYCLLDCW